MSEHQKQTAFFKALVQDAATPVERQLRERILKAEGNLRCCLRAMWKVLVLVAVSVIGGLYTVVVTPEVAHQQGHLVRKVFEVLTVGSLISLAAYTGFWLYYRAVLFQIHSECRRLLFSILSREQYISPASGHTEFIGAH